MTRNRIVRPKLTVPVRTPGSLIKPKSYKTGVGRHTMWLPASAWIPRITSGPSRGTIEMATNKNIYNTLDFDAAAIEYAQCDIRMPKSWDLGNISFKALWSHAATAVNFTVIWALFAHCLGDGDALDFAMPSGNNVVDTGGTTNTLYQSAESAAIAPDGAPAGEDVMSLMFARAATEAGDTLAVDARLHGVAVFFIINAPTDT